MPESLTDILAAALEQHHGPSYFPGKQDVTVFGDTPADCAATILAAIPAPEREAWETGRLLAEVVERVGDGRRITLSRADHVADNVWSASVSDWEWEQQAYGPTASDALTDLLANLGGAE